MEFNKLQEPKFIYVLIVSSITGFIIGSLIAVILFYMFFK